MSEPGKPSYSFDQALAAILKPLIKEAVREAMSQNGHSNKELPTTVTLRPYLTIKEAADMSRLASSTIRLYIRKRELKAQKVGSRVIIKRTELEQFLATHPM